MSRDALIVGINKYRHITSLKASANDAEAVAQRLGSQFRIRRFPEDFNANKQPIIATSADVDAMTLEEAIAGLFLPDGKDIPETALFYFSGHGLRKPSRPKKRLEPAHAHRSPERSHGGIDQARQRRLVQHQI